MTRRHRSAALAASAFGTVAALVVGLAPAAQATPPPTPRFGKAIDRLAAYVPQSTCSPTPKPGVVAVRTMVLRAYPTTGDYGITRACDIGGTSEHKEGRAWDWKVSSVTQHATADELIHWLLAKDGYGHVFARARRLGVMYIIFDHRIWGAYRSREGWRDYPCSGVTGCHEDHVHISFSWDGALQRTSWWTGKPAPRTTESLPDSPATAAVPWLWKGGTLPQPLD